MQVRLNFLSMYKKSSFRLKFLCTYTYNNFCLSHQEYLCPKYIKATALSYTEQSVWSNCDDFISCKTTKFEIWCFFYVDERWKLVCHRVIGTMKQHDWSFHSLVWYYIKQQDILHLIHTKLNRLFVKVFLRALKNTMVYFTTANLFFYFTKRTSLEEGL